MSAVERKKTQNIPNPTTLYMNSWSFLYGFSFNWITQVWKSLLVNTVLFHALPPITFKVI